MRRLVLALLAVALTVTPTSAGNSLYAWIISVSHLTAGRLDYNKNTTLVTYDDDGGDGYFDVWKMNYDGTGRVCVTCDHADLTVNKHIGQPAWNKAGTFILFQAQNELACADADAVPGTGDCNDIWAIDVNGTDATMLYEAASGVNGGVLHVSTSADDSKIFFSEKVGTSNYRLVVCDVEFVGTPSASGCTTYAPGTADFWYESHQFMDGGTDKLLFACMIDAADNGLEDVDSCTYVISTTTLTKLTNTDDRWDEHAHQCETNGRIVWSSSWGNANTLHLDWGVMNSDGTNQKRVTFYNEPGHKDYVGGIIPADNAWIDCNRFMGFLMINTVNQTGILATWNVGLYPQARYVR